MPRAINTTFRSLSWEEQPIGDDAALPRMTRASCTQEYTGDIVGRSTLEYLMIYCEDDMASFVGMERVVGTLGGRSGSFALRHEGVFEKGVARMTLTVVEGAGTGELRGVQGSGRFESAHAETYSVTLQCVFDD